MSLYSAIAQSAKGRRQLAKSRLRYRILSVLHEALSESGISQVELARRADVTKSAAHQALNGNGNLRPDTVATYLDAMGFELRVELVPAGSARSEATGWASAPPLRVQLVARACSVTPASEAGGWGHSFTTTLALSGRVSPSATVGASR